jgi:hypothetical protein
MEWSFSNGYLTKGQLAILDMLLHNNWERPIYFAFTVPNSNFMGLDKYLFNEGFALRLIPKIKDKIPSDSPINETEAVNTDVMYTNLMTKFNWDNLKTAKYLDPESQKMIFLSVNKFNELAKNLIFEGKIDSARKVMKQCLNVIPVKTTYDPNFALGKYEMIGIMYQIGMKNEANDLLKQSTTLICEELDYHQSLIQNKENLGSRDIQLNLFVLTQFDEMTRKYGETALNREVSSKLKVYESQFGMTR